MKFTASRILALVAVVIFVLAAVDAWPDDLAENLAAIPLGLAFFAASFVLD